MSISVRCPKCRELVSAKRSSCSHCGDAISTQKRDFWVRYRQDGKSVKKRLGFISLKEAKDVELMLLAGSKNTPTKINELTWGEVAESYLTKLKSENASPGYQNDNRLYLRRMQDAWNNCLVIDITPSRIKDFRARLRNKGLSEATLDRHLSSGKAAWNYAVDNHPNPFSRVKLYRPENEVVRLLTDDERSRLLDAAHKVHTKLYQMLIVSMSTGLRKNNVIQLRRSEVNFESGVISLRQKGDLSHSIPMNESCRNILKSIPDNGSDYFWLTSRGNPYRVDWRKPWEKAKQLAGISPEFRWHDLRHDAGTRIYTATGDIYATQRFLGHRQATTTKRYAHFLKDKLQATADVLNIESPHSVPLPSSE